MRFQFFRQGLLGVMVLISVASIFVCIEMLPRLQIEKTFYLSVAVQSAFIGRSLYSIIRKPFLKSFQGIGSELIGLFILVPFEAMLLLIISTGALENQDVDLIPKAVKVVVLLRTSLNFVYTFCLSFASILTAMTFDLDVWFKDIDASPCPIPGPLLTSWLHTKFVRLLRCSPADEKFLMSGNYCLPGCNCGKKHDTSNGGEVMELHVRNSTAIPNCPEELLVRDISRPQSLVRIPNAAEQRRVITVAFEVA